MRPVKIETTKQVADGLFSNISEVLAPTIVDETLSATSENPVQNKVIKAELDKKVDKVAGKQLSTEDYTSAEKTKLASLSNYNDTAIQKKASDNTAAIETEKNRATNAEKALTDAVATKVDKVSGKGLSTNDYTAAEKQKLAGLSNYNDTEIKTSLNGKQATLVSGTNIKTISNISLLGNGNISIAQIGAVADAPNDNCYYARRNGEWEQVKSFGYVDNLIFDKSVTDPSNITGDVNGNVTKDLSAKFTRHLCKKTADGEVMIIPLLNSTSYEDGSPAAIDGTEGDVVTFIPDIYYKFNKIDNNKFSYKLANYKVDDSFIHVPQSLLGTYKGFVENNKFYSRSGVEPTTNITYSLFEQYANARGTGYSTIDYHQHCMLALMFYAKHGNRNSQAVLGAGTATYNPATVCGTSNSLWNTDTTSSNTGYVNGFSIEGLFGGIYEVVNSSVSIIDRVWNIKEFDGIVRKVTAGSGDGWITNIAAESGPYFDMIPIAVGGSDSTYYSDYYYQNSNSRCLLRSYYSSHTNGGVACTNASLALSNAHTHVGSRLAFRGVIRRAQSVAEFKSLPVL